MSDTPTDQTTTSQPVPGAATTPEATKPTGDDGDRGLTEDTPEATEQPETPVDGDQDADPTEDHTEQDTRVRKARREAANLRTRLHDTETERDTLTADLTAAQDALAATRRAQAADVLPGVKFDVLERLGLDLTEHLTDDGTVDLDSARDAATRLAVEAGLMSHGPKVGRNALPPGWEDTPANRRIAHNLRNAAPLGGNEGSGNWLQDALNNQ
ncbi:hypothetical protein [Corynebacterium variabile]|uniref:Scaffolding protein n=1 Tax=Corynebacterium variabile TaxID=1727 RepID=A0A4Y4C833_9CORY|nr:hypothetical protein [Corynebacterium variabile]GEC87584.1 hypothetical protein CVA01_28980 [Corynebacterium variabile]